MQKYDVCPICKKKVQKPNTWVVYHVRYDPPITIIACKFCNFAEWALRNDVDIRYNRFTNMRVPYVINLQKKFNINL